LIKPPSGVISKNCAIHAAAAERALRQLGRDLALARRKRGIATSDMAARLFASRDTLWRLERGDPTVALGTLVTAAFILNLHERIANLAAPASDDLGLSLDQHRLPQRIRRQKYKRMAEIAFKIVAPTELK
jgi:transcriptional regulator with XRE-family HTH domain